MLDEKPDISWYRNVIRNKQREATRLCIELELTGNEVGDLRKLEDIRTRLDQVLVVLKAA